MVLETRKTLRLVLVSLIALALGLTSCRLLPGASTKEWPQKYQEFFSLPLPDQIRKFEGLPLDEQFDIAVLETRIHPPHTGFDIRIASKGEAVIPFLMDRLDKEEDDQRSSHAIKLLYLMSNDFYDLRGRQEIVDGMQEAIHKMSDGPSKQASEAMLREISG